MNTWDKCQNCGADYGLHHYKTNHCPVGGREAPVGRVQEWNDAVFVKDTGDIESKLALMTSERDRLAEALSDAIDLIKLHHDFDYEEKYVSRNNCLLCQNKNRLEKIRATSGNKFSGAALDKDA